MQWGAVLEGWNSRYGDKLNLSPEVMAATFAEEDENNFIVSTRHFNLLCKKENDKLRLHVPLVIGSEKIEVAAPNAVQLLKAEAQKRGVKKIVFGGGEHHLFPGVPLYRDLAHWLKWFSGTGTEVCDFRGRLDVLVKNAEDIVPRGTLRNARGEDESRHLLEFVDREFPGRWSREIREDSSKSQLHFYYAYFVEAEIVGYVRLYAWSQNYWGPGLYFAQVSHKSGGLGPIGVASDRRGQGIGEEILKESWNILKERECATVRIDWTTETAFYLRRGLEIVQTYQPAIID